MKKKRYFNAIGFGAASLSFVSISTSALSYFINSKPKMPLYLLSAGLFLFLFCFLSAKYRLKVKRPFLFAIMQEGIVSLFVVAGSYVAIAKQTGASLVLLLAIITSITYYVVFFYGLKRIAIENNW